MMRVVCAAVSLLLLAGCHKPPPPPDVLRTEVERGPLKLIVEAEPKEPWVGDTITLTVRVQTPDDQLVRFPAAADFGELSVTVDAAREPQPAPAGGLDWRQTYSISALTGGPLQIPPTVIRYGRKPADPSARVDFTNELASASLTIPVQSALTPQDSVTQPRDITGTLALPRARWPAWRWATVIGAAVALLAATVWLARIIRRRLHPAPPPLLPEIWALRALAELEAREWFESGRVQEFYYRLSEIVRAYIERKFDLAAPEMTTEEFLGMLLRQRGALPYNPDRLREFLEACDVVKYAAFHPRLEDAENALRTARAFVDATAAAASAAAATQATTGGQAA